MSYFKNENTESCLGAVLVVGFILIVVVPYVLQWAWGWVIPDVFSGAVAEGLLPATITYVQSFKMFIFLAIFVGVSK